MVRSVVYCTGGEIRTPINGFGDRYSTLELHPYFALAHVWERKDNNKFSLSILSGDKISPEA